MTTLITSICCSSFEKFIRISKLSLCHWVPSIPTISYRNLIIDFERKTKRERKKKDEIIYHRSKIRKNLDGRIGDTREEKGKEGKEGDKVRSKFVNELITSEPFKIASLKSRPHSRNETRPVRQKVQDAFSKRFTLGRN